MKNSFRPRIQTDLVGKSLRRAAHNLRDVPRNFGNALLARKVKRIKGKTSSAYTEHPNITAILQFFNRRKNIDKLIAALRTSGIQELIIIDDGSIDGSYSQWMRHLTGPNDFLLRSNDIFEVRTYDRAIGMARGELVCLLQDDDVPPEGDVWVKQALLLFDRFPDMIMLGGRNGSDLLIPDLPAKDRQDEYKVVGNIAGCPGVNKYVLRHGPTHVDPLTGIPFMFTMTVDRAPVFLRRTEFVRLGGINQRFAPFQCDDVDASIRAWLSGLKVGLYECPFRRNVGIGGMRLFQEPEWKARQIAKSWALIYELYGSNISNNLLQSLVDESNRQLSLRK